MIQYELALGVGLIGGIILAMIAQAFLFIQSQKKRFSKLEENLIKNTIPLIQKIDSLEAKFHEKGGGKMNEDIKKLYRALVKKIEETVGEAKDEILERQEELIEVLTEKDTKTEEPEEVNKHTDDYSEVDDYEGDRKVDFDDVMGEIDDKKKDKKSKRK